MILVSSPVIKTRLVVDQIGQQAIRVTVGIGRSEITRESGVGLMISFLTTR